MWSIPGRYERGMMKQFDFAENFVAAAPKINIDVKNDDTCHERRRRCVENI